MNHDPSFRPPPMTLPRLYPKQRAAILCPSRYTIIEATTKAGKTVGALAWLLMKAGNEGKAGRNYWWIAPIVAQAKIAFRRMKGMLTKYDPGQGTWDANESELRIDLLNGASMWFKGADNPDTLYGDDVYAAVMDEASRQKEQAWHAVRSTLTATKGPVKIIGNVRGRKNWAYMLARKAEAGSPGMSYFKLTAHDAVEGGILDAAEVEDARDKLPESVFRELYLAEPSDDGGNPFGIAAIQRCKSSSLSSQPPVAWGIDLAKSVDWTVACALDADRRVCQLERWRADWNQTKRRLLDLIGDTPTLIDSTGVGDPIVEDIARERRNVSGFKFTSGSKQQLMEGLAAAIQRTEIRFPSGWLVSELEAFEFEYRNAAVRYSAPDGMHDDGVCALALADHCWRDLTHNRISVDSGFYVLSGSN